MRRSSPDYAEKAFMTQLFRKSRPEGKIKIEIFQVNELLFPRPALYRVNDLAVCPEAPESNGKQLNRARHNSGGQTQSQEKKRRDHLRRCSFYAISLERENAMKRGRVVVVFAAVVALLSCVEGALAQVPASSPQASEAVRRVADWIVEARYKDAVSELEQLLTESPQDQEAAIYLATARAYLEKDALKAREFLEEGVSKGGGASFVVRHSHEVTFFSEGDPNDYCRGWLHFRKGEILFAPEHGAHGFRVPFSEVSEVKKIRKLILEIKMKKDISYKFSPRSRLETEVLLIMILHQRLSRK
ncbi:MAG: tetratricopeptide repeat protein [Blastocatellia bacterium]|nr:tetratricopeptide repeat protein [Blastocatellia bacterium]